MAIKIELTDGLNIRNIKKVFDEKINNIDYSSEIEIVLPEDSSPDLAGLQLLVSLKKSAEEEGGSVEITGLSEGYEKYFS